MIFRLNLSKEINSVVCVKPHSVNLLVVLSYGSKLGAWEHSCTLYRHSVLINGDVDKFLACSLVETDLQGTLVVAARWCAFILNHNDCVSFESDLLVSFSKDSDGGGHLISIDDSAFVSLEGTSGDIDCLASSVTITLALVRTPRHQAVQLLLSSVLVVPKRRLNIVVAHVDYLVCFDSEKAMAGAEHEEVGRALNPHEKLVFINCSHLAQTI